MCQIRDVSEGFKDTFDHWIKYKKDRFLFYVFSHICTEYEHISKPTNNYC